MDSKDILVAIISVTIALPITVIGITPEISYSFKITFILAYSLFLLIFYATIYAGIQVSKKRKEWVTLRTEIRKYAPAPQTIYLHKQFRTLELFPPNLRVWNDNNFVNEGKVFPAGSGYVTNEIEIENLAKEPIQEYRSKGSYDVYDIPNVAPSDASTSRELVDVFVGGERRNFEFARREISQTIDATGTPTSHLMNFEYIIPVQLRQYERCQLIRRTINTKTFLMAFPETSRETTDYIGVRVSRPTKKARLEVYPPGGYSIGLFKCDKSDEHGNKPDIEENNLPKIITTFFCPKWTEKEVEIGGAREKVAARRISIWGEKLVWEIDKPVLGYTYKLHFSLAKEGE
ncbi:MAG: hypothetical protein ACE5OZ_18830 [Candidatus Heimdallarchaeota archaeon]